MLTPLKESSSDILCLCTFLLFCGKSLRRLCGYTGLRVCVNTEKRNTIISFQDQKGGVGKTTIPINLAHALAVDGFVVLVVDADLQGGVRDWASVRESSPPFLVVGMNRPTIHRDLFAMADNYDHIVIDASPRVSELARSALLSSALIVIPVQPSPYDVWAVKEIVSLIQAVSVCTEKIKPSFAVNRKSAKTVIC